MPNVRLARVSRTGITADYLVVARGACRLAALPRRRAADPHVLAADAAGRPIILVTVDTLRADRLGAYGSAKGLTPALDRAGAGRRALHRRRDPGSAHAAGACDDAHRPAPGEARRPHQRRVPACARRADARRSAARRAATPPARSSAATRCRRRPVSHAASTATTTTSCARRAPSNVRPTKSSARRSRGSTQHRSQPFFAWLHLFDPHSPYAPPAPFAAAHADAPYDGEVAYTDAAIGRLFEHLQRSGLFSRAADPHRRRSWRVARRARRAHARHVSLRRDRSRAAARQASRRGGRARRDRPGRNGRSGADDRGDSRRDARRRGRPEPAAAAHGPGRRAGDPDRPAYAESYYQNVLLGWSPLRAVRTSRWKFIEAPRPELYDLESDPGELHNRVDDRAGARRRPAARAAARRGR